MGNLFFVMALLTEGLTQVLIPVAALIGLGFALVQWYLVSKVRVSGEASDYDGYKDSLIDAGEFEEGVDNFEVSIKVAEIQNAISVGELSLSHCIFLFFFFLLTPYWVLCYVLVELLMIEISGCLFACNICLALYYGTKISFCLFFLCNYVILLKMMSFIM